MEQNRNPETDPCKRTKVIRWGSVVYLINSAGANKYAWAKIWTSN